MPSILTEKSGDIIRTIRERLSIVDLIGRYVTLKQQRNRWVAPCPFHKETHPSFSVNEEKGFFYCFGCQEAGDIFDFYSRINGVDFREALRDLAAEAGVEAGDWQADPAIMARRQDERALRRQILEVNEKAAGFFVSQLADSAEAQAYIRERGLSGEIIRSFRLGWAGQNWRMLTNHLGEKDIGAAVASGLVCKSGQNALYDRFRGRLIFPITTAGGQTVGFGGRVIHNDDRIAKYINSPESPVYCKGKHLYGLEQARQNIREHVILTEGYMDVLTLHQYGYTCAVGVLGTALTEEQVQRICHFTKRVLLLFDGDEPGRKAALRACEMLLTRGIYSKVVLLPQGEDIDSLLRTQGRDAFEKILSRAPEGLDFCIAELSERSALERVRWARDFLSSLDIPELIEPSLRKLSTGLDLGENALRRNLGLQVRKHPPVLPDVPASEDNAEKMRELQIMSYAVRYPDRLKVLHEICADILVRSDFGRSLWKKLERHGDSCEPFLDNAEEVAFWNEHRGVNSPPRDNGDSELPFLQRMVDVYFAKCHQMALLAALHALEQQKAETPEAGSDGQKKRVAMEDAIFTELSKISRLLSKSPPV